MSFFDDLELQWTLLCEDPHFIEKRNKIIPQGQNNPYGACGEAAIRLALLDTPVELYKETIDNSVMSSKDKGKGKVKGKGDMLIGLLSPDVDAVCTVMIPTKNIELRLPKNGLTRILDSSFIPLRYGKPTIVSTTPVLGIYAMININSVGRKRFLDDAWYYW